MLIVLFINRTNLCPTLDRVLKWVVHFSAIILHCRSLELLMPQGARIMCISVTNCKLDQRIVITLYHTSISITLITFPVIFLFLCFALMLQPFHFRSHVPPCFSPSSCLICVYYSFLDHDLPWWVRNVVIFLDNAGINNWKLT